MGDFTKAFFTTLPIASGARHTSPDVAFTVAPLTGGQASPNYVK